jgi:hypothetical protein
VLEGACAAINVQSQTGAPHDAGLAPAATSDDGARSKAGAERAIADSGCSAAPTRSGPIERALSIVIGAFALVGRRRRR